MPESAQGGVAVAVGGATVGAFLVGGVGAYLDRPFMKPLVKVLGARNGPDLMLAFPFAHGRKRKRSARSDAVAVAVFASYPLLWWLGWDHGRRARP
jgi:hypothetical protein